MRIDQARAEIGPRKHGRVGTSTGEDPLLGEIVRGALAALERDYRSKRSETIALLEHTLKGKGQTDWDDLARDLHAIAGTAGHFGEEHLGMASRNLEHQLRGSSSEAEKMSALRASWPAFARAV